MCLSFLRLSRASSSDCERRSSASSFFSAPSPALLTIFPNFLRFISIFRHEKCFRPMPNGVKSCSPMTTRVGKSFGIEMIKKLNAKRILSVMQISAHTHASPAARTYLLRRVLPHMQCPNSFSTRAKCWDKCRPRRESGWEMGEKLRRMDQKIFITWKRVYRIDWIFMPFLRNPCAKYYDLSTTTLYQRRESTEHLRCETNGLRMINDSHKYLRSHSKLWNQLRFNSGGLCGGGDGDLGCWLG